MKIEVISPFTSGSEAYLVVTFFILPILGCYHCDLTEIPLLQKAPLSRWSITDFPKVGRLKLQSILCHLFPSPSIPQKVPKTPSPMSLSLVICLQCICGSFATKSHCIWDMKSPKNLNDGTPITMAKQLGCPRKLGSMVGIPINNIPILHSWDIYWGENKPLIRSPLIPTHFRAPGVLQAAPQIGPSAFVQRDPNRGDRAGDESFWGRKWSTYKKSASQKAVLKGGVMINRYMGVSQKWGKTPEMDGENTGTPY